MPVDDLPTDVLTELGRVTWAAIVLEDYIENLCSIIDPANLRTDMRSVSQKIHAAPRILVGWPDSSTHDEAAAWLEHAHAAVECRNAALHATPLVLIEPEQHAGPWRLLLGEMPHKGKPYVERPLTVESLAELRSVLVAGTHSWHDLVIAVGTEQRAIRTSNEW